MKTFTPEIAWHNRDPVYSVDLQPKIQESCLNGTTNGSGSASQWYRLATSGTNSQVVIWKIWHRDNPAGSVGIDPISQLTRHEKAVNVVRFTPTGEDVLALRRLLTESLFFGNWTVPAQVPRAQM